MPPDDLDDESAQQDRPPRRSPTIRTIAMPADTNPAGDIFGGWLMSQMDLAAGTVAALTARGRSATIAVEGMKFLRPVKVGDEVSLFADLVRVGRSSMHIRVQAWRRQREQEASEKVTQATFTFVALDDDGRARPIDQSGLADSQPEHDQRQPAASADRRCRSTA